MTIFQILQYFVFPLAIAMIMFWVNHLHGKVNDSNSQSNDTTKRLDDIECQLNLFIQEQEMKYSVYDNFADVSDKLGIIIQELKELREYYGKN